MRRVLFIGLLLLMGGLVAGAQEAQRTPPGGDMVGSDRSLHSDDIRTMPSPSPDQNQRMTGSAGTSTGYEKVPAYGGTSIDEARTRQSTGSPVGLQGQASATAGRRRAHSGSGTGAPPAKSVKPRHHAKRSRQGNATAPRR